MNIPFLNITASYQMLKPEIDKAVTDVLASGKYILGPNVHAFEQEFSQFHEQPYSVALASGTDALLLAIRSCGIKAGDEVIVPAFTFISTVSTVAYAGATPVFADVDPRTFNLTAETIRKSITKKTKAVILVYLYGQMSEMDSIIKLCKEKKLILIEDVAQAIGAEYKGIIAGSFGKASCFSFYPTKNLGAMGDAGMAMTANKSVYQNLLRLRDHGQSRKYHFEELGYNSRLDEIHAAILRIKLAHLLNWITARRNIASIYQEQLAGISEIQIPLEIPHAKHVYNLYTIRAKRRDLLQEFLREQGVGSAVHYPRPLHLQKAFSHLKSKKGDFPEAEKAAREVISLPLYPEMPPEHVAVVAEKIKAFYSKKK